MLQKQNLTEEFKDYEYDRSKFKSIRNKFEQVQSAPFAEQSTRSHSPRKAENIINRSFENLNNSIEESTSSAASTESAQTVYEAECHEQQQSPSEYTGTSKYICHVKSNSVTNLFSSKDADFLKFSISCRNPTLSKSLAKSNGDNLDDCSFRDTGYEKTIFKNDMTISNDENLGYLEPISKINGLLDDSEPFPFPPSSFVQSRTDLFNDEDTFDNVPAPDDHFYVNNIGDNIVDQYSREKQLELLNDLIMQEKDYIEVLTFFYEEYYCKLVESKFITSSQKLKIFSKIGEIYEFHVLQWLPALVAKAATWYQTSTPTISDIFVQHLADVHSYLIYIDNFKESMKYLDFVCESQPMFKLQIHEIDQEIRQPFLSLATRMKFDSPTIPIIKSFMIYFQTWPVYTNNFLTSNEAFISVDSIDFADYNAAISYYNDLAAKSSELTDEMKQFEIVKDLQSRLGNKFNILNKKRVILKEGPVITLSPMLGNIIKIYIVLLNDLLIICDQAENEFHQLRPKRPLDVIGMLASSDVSAFTADKKLAKIPMAFRKSGIDPVKGFSISVPCVQKVFKFYARSVQEKNKWYNAFKTVAQANKFENEIDRTSIGTKPPKFIPFKLQQYCFKCRVEFTTINRKHHCKACGYIFCKNCSKMQVSLDYEASKKSRICDLCHDSLFKTFRSKPPSLTQIEQSSIEHLMAKR